MIMCSYWFMRKIDWVMSLFSFYSNNIMENYDKLHESFYAEWRILWFKFIDEFMQSKNLTELLRIQTSPLIVNFIEKYPHYAWNFNTISNNGYLTIKFILNNLNKEWNWKTLSRNKSITMEDVLNNPNIPWNYDELSANPNVTTKHISDNPQIAWNWQNIGNSNPNLTMDFILENYEKLSEITSISVEKTLKNWILWNESITLDFVFEHPDYRWEFSLMSRKTVTEEFIIAHPNWYLKNWWELVENKNISLEYLFEHAHEIRNCHKICHNPNLTIDFVLNHPEFPWKNTTIGLNPNISIKSMLEHPELETYPDGQTEIWVLTGTSANPNLTIDFVLDNAELPWYINNLATNHFKSDCDVFIANKMSWLFLATIHEQINHSTYNRFTDIERILFDDYILKTIVKY